MDTQTPSPLQWGTHNTIRLQDRMTVFVLDFHRWGGSKQLADDDIETVGARSDPEVVTKGQKKLVDPQTLAIFERKRKEIERRLMAVGTKFLGGYAVGNDRALDLKEKLDEIVRDLEREADQFVDNLDCYVDAWVAKHPSMEQAIRRGIDPPEKIRARFSFAVLPLHLETAAPFVVADDEKEEDDIVTKKTSEMAATIFTEVEKMAESMRDGFEGKKSLSQRKLGPFRRIRDKLDALSFVDYRLDPVASALSDWLTRLPKTGDINGPLFFEGWALMRLVSDADAMSRHGQGLLDLDSLKPVAADTDIPSPGVDETVIPIAEDSAHSDEAIPADSQADANSLFPEFPDFDDLDNDSATSEPSEDAPSRVVNIPKARPEPKHPATSEADSWFF